MFIFLQGGELFAKRRKKADKWVVDESQIGMGEHPSVFADEFIAQQSMAQQQMHEEKTQGCIDLNFQPTGVTGWSLTDKLMLIIFSQLG